MSANRPVSAQLNPITRAGTWVLSVRAHGMAPVNITAVRNVPTKINSFSFSDPFGPKDMTFTVPAVTLFDQLGVGDLAWCVKHADVTLEWIGDLPNTPMPWYAPGATTGKFAWEGYLASPKRTTDGLVIQCKGAMLQLDNWLAKPEYTYRPLPYEWAISRQFAARPAFRCMPAKITFPSWWTKTFDPAEIRGATGGTALAYQLPLSVTKGQKWTGLLTRSTGSWDAVLTSYIQGLLGAMYTDRGRWTLELIAGRQPWLFHRDMVTSPVIDTAIFDPVLPGVVADFDEDWEQTITDVYVQGTSLAGVAFTGMQVSADGSTTTYVPASAQRQTYPAKTTNPWLDPSVMPKEVQIQVQQGLSADDAGVVATAHRQRFADSGYTGTLTLQSDPIINGVVVSRFLVRAGMSVQVRNLFGSPEGVVGRVTESTADVEASTVTLTIDTKNRDALTVAEVTSRGRDALSVNRMVLAGQYASVVPDVMLPWSYAENSGYIPGGRTFSSRPLFTGMPNDTAFPWESWTKAHPPKDPKWAGSYMHVGPASTVADANWTTTAKGTATKVGFPIRMAAAGQIRLTQLAAYDRDGNVLKIPFHFSLWYVSGANVLTMPALPADQVSKFPPYKAGQRYPFFRDAFESTLSSGAAAGTNDPLAYQSAGPVRIYGTFYEKAGYFPGSYAEGDRPTGLLQDETVWDFSLANADSAVSWNPYDPEKNRTNPLAGYIYGFVYADAQDVSDAYFLGRLFRVEPSGGV